MKKKLLSIVLIAALFLSLPYQAFANHAPINEISFDEVEGLMFSRSRDIIDNNLSFGKASAANSLSEAAIDAALTQINNLIAAINPNEDEKTAALAYLLNVQKQSLDQQKAALNSSQLDKTMGLQAGMANNSIVWGAQVSYITCKSLEKQISEMENTKSVLEKQYATMKLQNKLGMLTNLALQSFENQVKDFENGLKQMKDTYNSLIGQINIFLSQEYDTKLTLKDLPRISENQINNIDVEQDYNLALLQSYTVLLSENDDEKEADATRKFRNGFYNAYQTLLNKEEAVKIERSKFAVAEQNMKISDIKFKLGMISALQHENDKSTYLSSKVALDIAEDALVQAYEAYRWAKRGLIVSSGSSSGSSSSGAPASGRM